MQNTRSRTARCILSILTLLLSVLPAGLVLAEPAPVQISVPQVTGQYSDTVMLQAQLGPTAPVGRTVEFRVNGTAAGVGTVNAAGAASLMYTISLPAGVYTTEVSFAGDDQFAAASGTGQLTVVREDATITYTGDTTSTGSYMHLSAVVSEAADGAMGNITLAGTIKFEIRRTSDGAVAGIYMAHVNAAGVAYTVTTTLPEADYDVITSLSFNSYYTAADCYFRIRPQHTPVQLTVSPAAAQVGQTATLRAQLSTNYHPVPAGSPVSFAVQGVPVGTATTDSSGVATLAYTVTQGAGAYTVTASYGGSSMHTPASGSSTLTVTAAATTLAATGGTVQSGGSLTLTATLTAGGQALAGKTITFSAGPTTVGQATTDAAGVARLNYTATQAPGTYTVTAAFAGDASYAAATAEAALTVTAKNTALTVPDRAAQHGDTVDLTAKLTTASGQPVAGQTVSFSVQGAPVGTATTDSQGTASLPYTVTQANGSYTISADYAGAELYQPASGSATLRVSAAPTELAVPDVTGELGAFTITATLTSGGKPLAGKAVFFRIAPWVSAQATTDAAGVARLVTPLLTEGSYTIVATFMGDTSYLSSTGSASLTLTKRTTALTLSAAPAQYSDRTALTATLTGGGQPLGLRSIRFFRDGTLIGESITNDAGTAVLPYTVTQAAGAYAISAEFAGDSTYAAATATGTLTVAAENATLSYTGATKIQGGKLALKAQVTQAADGSPGAITNAGSVQFKLVKAGTSTVIGTYTAVIDSTGAAATTVSVPNTSIDITISLVPNGYFQAPETAVRIK